MASPTSDHRRTPVEFGLSDVGHEPSWAHVSGWAQLSGSRQTVSCIVACANQARALVKLLPMLSDTLTECGYPWELIAVDCASTDETLAVLSPWAELPGIRLLQVDPPQDTAQCFAAGMLRARGDAVICIDPAVAHPPGLIAQMILRWESNAMLVHARRDTAYGHSVLTQWDEAEMQRRIRRSDFVLPPECTQLGLLDRQLIDWMMQAG